jgi:hypothetical protein
MPYSSDSDRDDDTGLSDDQVPSEDENSVTCVPATDDKDSSVVVLSEDIKRPRQSSSLRSSITRAQKLCCLALKEPIHVPEFIDPVFTKTSPKRSFSLNRKRPFWLVSAKTGSIISGTELLKRFSNSSSVLEF